MSLSFLNPLYNALGYVLAFFYSLIPNLGVAIILVTIAVMVVLYPLTAKQAKSMIAMQRVQPEIKKLQAKYKGDKQKLNEEMMKFYQENKINPLAGCLPLVVQLPIFFVLFRVLRTPYQHIPKTGSFSSLYNTMCGGFGRSCGSNAAHIHHLTFLGLDLQKTATDSSLGFPGALPYYLLVVLVMVTGFLQTKQAQSRTPAANKQMGTVMKILPIFFGIISLSFPAGLVLYFFVSNLFRLGQQELIFRRMGSALTAPKLSSGDKRGAAIDVESAERRGAKAELATPESDEEPDEPEAPPAAKAPAPRRPPQNDRRRPPRPAPRPTVSQPTPEPVREGTGGSGARGLRAFFQLPPPPPANGGGRPNGGARPSGGSRGAGSRGGNGTSGTSRGGPPPQRRSGSSKKKRKR
ncbi:MAG: YidC/Oxa1 family membrane protein insertase [Thermoplasmata archaeon]|nr:YidC/Oxa1 family membrane protein insertase [Thermoplasmata archaeon]